MPYTHIGSDDLPSRCAPVQTAAHMQRWSGEARWKAILKRTVRHVEAPTSQEMSRCHNQSRLGPWAWSTRRAWYSETQKPFSLICASGAARWCGSTSKTLTESGSQSPDLDAGADGQTIGSQRRLIAVQTQLPNAPELKR
jgi:hypothetical protein